MQKDTIIVRDTIVKIIEFKSKITADNVEFYKELLNSQNQTYNLIVFIFLGIIALFAGATWLYNRKLAKREIIKHTNKIFATERDKLITEFAKEFESELNLMKGESARLFAINCTGDHSNNLKNKFFWWLQCVNYYQRGGKGKAVAFATKNSLKSIKEIFEKRKKIECKKLILEMEEDLDKCFYNIIENIPDELHDSKVEIKKLFDKLML
jgi:hypothetical protein